MTGPTADPGAKRGSGDSKGGPAGPATLLAAGVWFGILAGLVEAGLRFLDSSRPGEWLFFGSQLLWMAPVADGLMLGAIGLGLGLLGSRWPRAAAWRPAAFVLVALGTLSVFFVFEQLHGGTALLLALGLALHLSRVVARRSRGFERLLRRTVGWAVALVASLAFTVHGLELLRERRSLAALPPAPQGAPNVLLLVLDTARARSMSLYGHSRRTTPELERFAREGVTFERALAPSSYTPPSHFSMMTGHLPHELIALQEHPLGKDHPTLAEVLAGRGYATAGFVANVGYAGREQRLDRGFAHFEEYRVSASEVALSSSLAETVLNHRRVRQLLGFHDILGRKRAADVQEDFLDWLGGRGEQPFFAFLNYYDAHVPYLPPAPFYGAFGPREPRMVLSHWIHQAEWAWWGLSPRHLAAEIAAYEGAIAYMDYELGRLFERLRAEGVLDDTIVIVTADHGEQWGEHGKLSHANSFYRQVLHVPLVIVYPRGRVPKGLRVSEPVSLRDLPATVADLAGLEQGIAFPGRSLARTWETERPARGGTDLLLAEYQRWSMRHPCVPLGEKPSASTAAAATATGDHEKSLVTEGYHYIRSSDGTEELYDFERDPDETRDLARTVAGGRVLPRMRLWLSGATVVCPTSEEEPPAGGPDATVFRPVGGLWSAPPVGMALADST